MAAIALVSTASGLVVAAGSERRAGIRGIVQEPASPRGLSAIWLCSVRVRPLLIGPQSDPLIGPQSDPLIGPQSDPLIGPQSDPLSLTAGCLQTDNAGGGQAR
jgi:hypothetical protein